MNAKVGFGQRESWRFKQLNLNKLSDASGLESDDKPTRAETDSSGCFGTMVSLAAFLETGALGGVLNEIPLR